MPIDRLPPFDSRSGDLLVVVETPKGSRNKYAYDPELGAFRLKFVLPEGTSFPYDFGFVPGTLGEDGDPLDVLVLLDAGAELGCVVETRLIGALRVSESKDGGEPVRNDRLLGVAVRARTHADVATLDDLRPALVEEIVAFFTHYAGFNGKTLREEGRVGPEIARALVEEGMARKPGA
jgi:inorganic pyrophosphatase